MAHFARIDSNNIVTIVHVLNNAVLMKDGEENEQQGVEFLQNLYNNNDSYIQTSYNQNFRKNYAGKGYTYDHARDAFIPPKNCSYLVLNEDTCLWEHPIPYPDDGGNYIWEEDSNGWITNPKELEKEFD